MQIYEDKYLRFVVLLKRGKQTHSGEEDFTHRVISTLSWEHINGMCSRLEHE